jgi:hypothetical protein
MSAFTPRPRARPVARFEGAKVVSPISVRTRAVFDALVVAALDPEIRSLSPAAPVAITLGGAPAEHVPDFVVTTETGAIVVDIRSPTSPDTGQARYEAVAAVLAAQGIVYEVREPPAPYGSPLVMNARSAWGCRSVAVAAPDQVRVLAAVAMGPVPLSEAAQAIRTGDGIAGVIALACRDVIALDLAVAPLGPDTPVRRLARAGAPSTAAMSTRGSP